jgi:putative sigma-54 modulation protein
MEFSIKSRNIELTPELKSYIERKLGHFDRKLENIMEIRVEVFEEHTRSSLDRHVVTVSISGANLVMHAEERGDTILNAVDRAAESITKQIERQKGKWQNRDKGGPSIRLPEEPKAPPLNRIAETRSMGVKPMSLAEAQDQMDILNFEFLMFLNTDSKKVNLLKRRPDGRFDLIVSEP